MYEWLTYAEDEKLQAAGNDPHGRQHEYLTRSSRWRVIYQNREWPVLSVPVSVEGPHSFVSLPYLTGEKVTVISENGINTCTISPQRLEIEPTVREHEVTFVPQESGHYVVQADGEMDRPLTISLMPEIEKPAQITRYYPAGIHAVDWLELQDDETIYLEDGAVLEAIPPHAPELPTCECDWAGKKTYKNFIRARGKRNLSILGRGIIDLSKLDWHERSMLSFSECKNVRIEGVTLIGTPGWTVTIDACDGVTINDVRCYGHRENSDGIDICSSNVSVSRCFLRTGDDAICVKGMRNPPVIGGEHILVQECVIWNDKVRCLGITAETKNDIHDVAFRRCDIVHSLPTWMEELGSLCVIVCDRGTVSDVCFEDIWIEQEAKYVINCSIVKDRWSSQKQAGQIRNITFRNIHAPSHVPLKFYGYDDAHRVTDILIENGAAGIMGIEGACELDIRKNDFTDNIVVRRKCNP